MHRKNFEYHLAIEKAELSYPTLFQDMNTNIQDHFKQIVKQLRESNSFYQNIPEIVLYESLIRSNGIRITVGRYCTASSI